MGEHSTDPLVSAYLNGYLRCISKQMAGLSRGQDMHQATQERHIVLTGQILEAIRSTAPPPKPSGRMNLRESWKALGESAKSFKLLLDLWRLYRAVPWGTLAWGLYVLARWLLPF